MKDSSNIGKLIGGTVLVLGLSLFGGFDRQAKAIDNDPPSTSQTASSSLLKDFVLTSGASLRQNAASIVALEERATSLERTCLNFEKRIVTLEQPKLNEGASSSTATPEGPRAEPPASKSSILKKVGKTVLEFSLFKGLVYLLGK